LEKEEIKKKEKKERKNGRKALTLTGLLMEGSTLYSLWQLTSVSRNATGLFRVFHIGTSCSSKAAQI
jgi:hypothetical protein